MATRAGTERGILVFSIWAVVGFPGLAFWLEGMTHDALALSLLGIGLVLLAFVAHIVVNAVFHQGFTRGEASLGIGLYGLFALLYVAGRLEGGMTTPHAVAGIALFGLLAAGFLIYLAARYGVRGAFSRFHGATHPARDGAP